MDTTQKRAHTAITKAYNTISTDALQVITEILPLDLAIR
jgi:hypothetical protein